MRSALAAALLIAVASADVSGAWAADTVTTSATIRDSLIKTVCLDRRGVVLSGVSPADGNPGCVDQRDLRPGERLPYHKHDHPNQGDSALLGYQRHDSFPVETASLGTVVEHSFDFGAGEGRQFGVFDQGSDGGDIAVLSPGRVSFAATEDGGAGFQLFVGECAGPVTPDALTHSWIVLEFPADRPAPLQGETVARLNDLTAGHQETCPARFNAAFTSWHIAPFRYRAAPGQGTPITLPTLISDHYGGERRDNADHVERFYFTRQLGGAGWGPRGKISGNRPVSGAKVGEGANRFAPTRPGSEGPAPGGAPRGLGDCPQ